MTVVENTYITTPVVLNPQDCDGIVECMTSTGTKRQRMALGLAIDTAFG
jgi:hypothetical protein